LSERLKRRKTSLSAFKQNLALLTVSVIITGALCLGALYAGVLVVFDDPRGASKGLLAPLVPLARDVYVNGYRAIWQTQRECVRFDPHLLYAPREGECRLTNAEFDVVFNFDSDGRVGSMVQGEADTPPVLVLGDSHAMGWGVGDTETFAAVLSRMLDRPVYNLAVSSYGTARELLRASAHPALSAADTVIIQYCDNDHGENLAFLAEGVPTRTPADFEKLFEYKPTRPRVSFFDLMRSMGRGVASLYRKMGFQSAAAAQAQAQAGPAEAFLQVLERYPVLAEKRLIVFESNAFHVMTSFTPSLEAAIEERGLRNITVLRPELGAEDNFVLDGHPNEAGHRALAHQLYAVITSSAE